MAAEAIESSMVRSYEVMRRRSVSYDYEKVFWNSAFGLGLVGLGWAAVKLGQTIAAVQKVVTDTTTYVKDPVTAEAVKAYLVVFDWVEGAHKNDVNTVPPPTGTAIQIFRTNPNAWANYKLEFAEAHPDVKLDPAGKVTGAEMDPALKLLAAVDNIYARWGAAMPLLVLGGNVGFEYARVYRLKRDMR